VLTEFELIRQIIGPMGGLNPCREDVRVGIGDDCAVLVPPPDQELVTSVDTLVEGVHFPREIDPGSLGYRSLAVALSDIAAMGAEPNWFTLALTIPNAEQDWLTAFAQGMGSLASNYQMQLIGGDTTKGPLTLSLQVFGFAPHGEALQRCGAKSADYIFVSGSLGDAGAGLGQLQEGTQEQNQYLMKRFTHPSPRIALGKALRSYANACIDISDGLSSDLGHILSASGLGAEIDSRALPLSDPLVASVGEAQARDLALTFGDDYELCFCIPEEYLNFVEEIAAELPLQITKIGMMTPTPGLKIRGMGDDWLNESKSGYRHF